MPLKKPGRTQHSLPSSRLNPRMRRIMPLSLRSHWGVSKYIVGVRCLRLDHPAKERQRTRQPCFAGYEFDFDLGRWHLAPCQPPDTQEARTQVARGPPYLERPTYSFAKTFNHEVILTPATICACVGRSLYIQAWRLCRVAAMEGCRQRRRANTSDDHYARISASSWLCSVKGPPSPLN